MKISNTHQALSKELKNPEVLTNPEPFLGPNWETVLRFWLYFESLTVEQKDELCRCNSAIGYDTRDRAYDLARNAAIEVIGEANLWAVRGVSPYLSIAMELIANLDDPFFLPLLVPEFNKQSTMTYSKTHFNLSKELKNPEVLTNPQKFLGPNWETVLRWWLYRESLTHEQKEDVKRRYWSMNRDIRERSCELSCHAASKVIGRDNRLSVKKISPFPTEITYELIANLDDPFFLPRIVPDFNKQPTMTYSKTHFNLSKELNNPEVLTNPQKFLGPNYKMVLDFWFYVDNNVVSDKLFRSKQNEHVEVWKCHCNGINQSSNTVDTIVGSTFRIAICKSCPTVYISLTTYEIISLYNYIEEGKKLVFLPLFGAFLDEWKTKQLKTAHFALTQAADRIYNLEGMSSTYRDVQKVIDEQRRALKIASVLKK